MHERLVKEKCDRIIASRTDNYDSGYAAALGYMEALMEGTIWRLDNGYSPEDVSRYIRNALED